MLDHNIELVYTSTKVSINSNFTSDNGDADNNYSQEAEGDEKAEVLVSFSSNQLVHICQDNNIKISNIKTRIIGWIELGELPRQAAGEEDWQACLLYLGGFLHHYCLS